MARISTTKYFRCSQSVEPQANQVAELRFTNLLTGQVQLMVPVAGTGTERSQRVALAGLPAGQCVYQLVMAEQLAAAPQKLLVNP